MNPRPLTWPSLLAIATIACGGGSNGPTGSTGTNDYSNIPAPPGGIAQFTVSPINLTDDSLGTITPLGNLGPPGHVLPTNHLYIYAVDFDHPPAAPSTVVHPVYMPATGALTFMLLQPSGDWKLEFRVTQNFFFYLDHVHPVGTLALGDILHAGDQVGTTNPGGSIDLGAFDLSTPLPGFVNPARYGPETLNCVTPWEYFTEPLKSQIYARQRRSPSAPSRDARIDLDVAGRLAGNWYEQSLPITETEGSSGWPKTLAFVYDYYDPSLVRISIGGTIAPPGVWTIPAGAPRPENVSVAEGLVNYSLRYTGSTEIQSGVMLVQMLDERTIKVEVFEGNQVSATAFDGNARTYIR